MLMKKLKNYNQLKDVELYVFLGGKTIKGKTADDILEIMKKCSFVKPISVIKNQPTAQYSCDTVQTTLNRTSTWCHCTNITASANNDINASTTAIVTNITTTANKQYSVLELYEQQLQKIKEEVKDELRLAKKKREIEHDERMIQMKRKKIDLLLQLTRLEQS